MKSDITQQKQPKLCEIIGKVETRKSLVYTSGIPFCTIQSLMIFVPWST